MRQSAGWAVSAGLVVAATAANAQGRRAGAYQATSDFDGPYVGGPPPAPGYYGAPPAYGPPPAAYAPPPGYGPSLLPVQEVYAVLRDNGFSPLGAPYQRGLIYVIAVIDRGGEDGRLVIDARNGRIIRFMPASRWSSGYYGERSGYYGDRYAPPPPYGPPGVLPPMAPSSSDARPPVSVPHLASRSVPLPQPKPSVAGKPPEPRRRSRQRSDSRSPPPAPRRQPGCRAHIGRSGSGRRSVDARSGRDRARARAEARAGRSADPGDAEGAGAGVGHRHCERSEANPFSHLWHMDCFVAIAPRNDDKKRPGFPGRFVYSTIPDASAATLLDTARSGGGLLGRAVDHLRAATPASRSECCGASWPPGISRTRSTWSRPCSSEAFFTTTKSASWKARSKARAAMPR